MAPLTEQLISGKNILDAEVPSATEQSINKNNEKNLTNDEGILANDSGKNFTYSPLVIFLLANVHILDEEVLAPAEQSVSENDTSTDDIIPASYGNYFIFSFIICCFHLGYEMYYDSHYALRC